MGKNRRNGHEWSGCAGYGARIGYFPQYRDSSLKKTGKFAKPVNGEYLKKLEAEQETDMEICNALAAERDEMCIFYHDQPHPIWLWWAVDHKTNTPPACTFGTRKHKYLDELLALLKPYSIGKIYADNHLAYEKKISAERLVTGKKNTQRIEREHMTLRTRVKRLCRKTLCFSKSKEIHIAVVGTFINCFFFGRTFDVSILV